MESSVCPACYLLKQYIQAGAYEASWVTPTKFPAIQDENISDYLYCERQDFGCIFGWEQRRIIRSSKNRKKQSKSGEDAKKTNRCKLVGGGDLHKCFPPHLDNKSTDCSCDAQDSWILVLFHNLIVKCLSCEFERQQLRKEIEFLLARFQAKTILSEMAVALWTALLFTLFTMLPPLTLSIIICTVYNASTAHTV